MQPSNPLVTAWYIDPYTETIQLVDTTDSLADLAKWVGTCEIGFFCQQENGDLVMIGADAGKVDFTTSPTQAQPELVPRAPAWQFLDDMRLFYGPALWVNLTSLHGLQTPYCSKKWLEQRIEFWGFANVVDIGQDFNSGDVTSHQDDDDEFFEDYMKNSDEETE